MTGGWRAMAQYTTKGFDAKGRPAAANRKFRSAAVDAQIVEVGKKIGDPELARIFTNCYANTLDTTVFPGTRNGKPPHQTGRSPVTVTRVPSRRAHTAMQASPQAARTTPPSGREPVPTATPKPAMRPAAATGAVGTRSMRAERPGELS